MLQIRSATKNDVNQLCDLIQEHAKQINMASEATLTAEYLMEFGFNRSPPSFKSNIVFIRSGDVEKLIGYMIYFNTYSTWVGKTMMVDDMYIQKQHIDDKYMRGFLNLILTDVKENGYNRLEFNITAGDILTYYHLSRGATNLGDSDLTVKYHLKGKDYTEPERWISYRIPKNVMIKMAKNE